ncbi:MAG: enoyl-CoA hydratase/isomerase family protein [Pseudomonadota bacterium]
MSEGILCEIRDGIGIVSLSRPERHNAFTQEMHVAFGAAIDAMAADPGVRVILLRGEGRSFCSGMDVTMIGSRAPGDSDMAYLARLQQVRLKQLDCPKPIVAALKNAVLGLGCEVALACDFRIAGSDLQLGVPEVAMGLVTDSGGLPLLNALIGSARTKYLILTGRRIDAATALAWGAVELVVDSDALDVTALAIAAEIAAQPPLAVLAARRIIDDAARGAIRAGLNAELLAQSALFKSQDYQEARGARRDGRPSEFGGT